MGANVMSYETLPLPGTGRILTPDASTALTGMNA